MKPKQINQQQIYDKYSEQSQEYVSQQDEQEALQGLGIIARYGKQAEEPSWYLREGWGA